MYLFDLHLEIQEKTDTEDTYWIPTAIPFQTEVDNSKKNDCTIKNAKESCRVSTPVQSIITYYKTLNCCKCTPPYNYNIHFKIKNFRKSNISPKSEPEQVVTYFIVLFTYTMTSHVCHHWAIYKLETKCAFRNLRCFTTTI